MVVRTEGIGLLNQVLGRVGGDVVTVHQELDPLVVVCADEDAEMAWMVAKDVLRASAHDDAVLGLSFLADDVGLELEQ